MPSKIYTVCICLFLCAALGTCPASDIHDAIRSGDSNRVAAAIAANPALINQPDENGTPPLHAAVATNDARIVSLLLSKGAMPGSRDKQGRSPLKIAVESDSVGCVRILILKTIAGYVDPLLDSRTIEGQLALKDGTLARANEILGKLVRLDPLSETVNFAYGLSWLSLGDPAPAGAAFDRVLQINPKNDRARVELARTRLAAKRYSEAKSELEKVLASNLPADVKQNVEAYLKDVNRRMTRWSWAGSIELSGLYDNNVNVGPDSELIKIAPISLLGLQLTELSIGEDFKPKDSTGIAASTGLRASYDLGQPNGWLLNTDAACYRNWLKESDYEIGLVQAGLGAKYALARGAFMAPLRVRHMDYGGSSLLWSYGIYPGLSYAPKALNGISLTTASSAELRNFNKLNNGHDSTYLSLNEIARKPLARGRYSIYGGAEIQYDNTDSSEYEYTGAGLLAGADARLPFRISAFTEARYLYKDYRGRNSLSPDDKKDNQYQLAAGLSHNITDRLTVSGVYNFIDNNSTFDLYEYQRQTVTLTTSFSF